MGSNGIKKFSFSEISKHNNFKDCWLLINGKVYDITEFVQDHPGGDDVLTSATWKDATFDFVSIGHSDDAKSKMEYLIGEIDRSTILSKAVYQPPQQIYLDQDTKYDFILTLFQMLFPLLILAFALFLAFFYHYKS